MADEHVLLIRKIVRPALTVPSVAETVRWVLKKPSVCVPEGAVVLSVVNKHHIRLRPLQFHFIRHRRCFMRRVVSVCFNNVTDGFGSCVRSTFVVPPSDFRRSNYANLIWAKWKILADALTVATRALWLDADVLILRNPFSVLNLLGNDAKTSPGYDIQYQSEPPPPETSQCIPPRTGCMKCPRINGGQLLLSSEVLSNIMYGARPHNLSNTDRLDQDWADAILFPEDSRFAYLLGNASHGNYNPPTRNYSSCILPPSFGANCWSNKAFVRDTLGDTRRPGAQLALGCRRATLHFNCIMQRREKGTRMKYEIDSWSKRCGNRTAYE